MIGPQSNAKVRFAAAAVIAFLLVAAVAQIALDPGAGRGVGAVFLGTRTAVWIGLLATGVSALLGVVAGSLAGWWGRRADAALSRGVELTSTLPILVVAGIVVSWPAGSLTLLGVCLGLLRGVELARVVRGEIRRVASEDFVLAARALGASSFRTLSRHVLPHCLRPVAVNSALTAAYAVGVEAALSFVGLRHAAGWTSWGSLLHPATRTMSGTLFASASGVVLLTWALYVLAEAGAEGSDPRLAHRRLGSAPG